jgi:pSer/pThr/pTyr-binding forkhead associated (FHA) protein
MAVRLQVKQRGEAGGASKGQEHRLEDEVITLGRDKSCQVVLAQMAVSRNHARISQDGTLFFVEDLGSAYGTQVNGKPLPRGEKRLLRNGDVIAIAQFDVVFDRVADLPQSSEKTSFVARAVVKDVMRGLGSAEGPYFRVMNGPKEGQRIEIADAQELVFGREEGVDVVLNDDLVSRRHAKVRRDWSGTHVEDLGSRNGIRVNKKRVKRKTLRDSDELEIGGVRLLYLDPSEVREAPVLPPSEEEENTISPDQLGGPTDPGPLEEPDELAANPAAQHPSSTGADEEGEDQELDPYPSDAGEEKRFAGDDLDGDELPEDEPGAHQGAGQGDYDDELDGLGPRGGGDDDDEDHGAPLSRGGAAAASARRMLADPKRLAAIVGFGLVSLLALVLVIALLVGA